ncbi:MAG: phospholipid carrier-dependent glycosyltransferase [Candidatus Daviesbacteria bacterium]|nr:phospholipid carrier-dependent glycosyltransferase [Candidatus Daviesbacteria bacterium]
MRKWLYLLLVFHLLANLIWILLDKSPLAWDQAGHTLISLNFVDFFKGISQVNFFQISDYYPPLVHIITALIMIFTGPLLSIGPLVVTGFFLMAISFLYLYTKELFNNEKVAILTACFFSFLPVVYGQSKMFLLEIPLIALILASLYFLEKSEKFSNLKNSLFAAIFLSFALLTKWVAIVYLLIPIIASSKLSRLKNLSLSFGIIVLISLPWYFVNFTNILNRATVSLSAETADPQVLFSLQNFIYYLQVLTNFHLTWLGMVLFLLAIPVLYFSKKKEGILITAVIVFIYLIFTLIPNKDPRYILPILPFVSIAIAYFLVKIIDKNKYLGILITFLVGFYYSLYFFCLSFGVPFNPSEIDYQRAIKLPVIGWVDYINLGKNTSGYLAPKFETITWPQKQIITDLGSKNPDTLTKILVLVDKNELNAKNLELYQREQKDAFIKFWAPYDLSPFSETSKMEAYLAYFDYVLIPDKSFGPEGALRHLAVLKQLKEYLIHLSPEKIGLIKQYNLPDGDSLFVYEIKF